MSIYVCCIRIFSAGRPAAVELVKRRLVHYEWIRTGRIIIMSFRICSLPVIASVRFIDPHKRLATNKFLYIVASVPIYILYIYMRIGNRYIYYYYILYYVYRYAEELIDFHISIAWTVIIIFYILV